LEDDHNEGMKGDGAREKWKKQTIRQKWRMIPSPIEGMKLI
jgi:hypothetical protein